MTVNRVGGVVLAAGASRRYRSPKQLVVVDGMTLLERVLLVAAEAGLTPVAAVVPVWLSRPANYAESALRWVRNPFPERGLSLSLRLGLDALRDDVDAAVILLGDQPGVGASTIADLIAARGERPLVAAAAGLVLAPPILIERSHFYLAAELSGDVGLRQVIEANSALVHVVPVDQHSADVDTPEDLADLRHP